MHGEHCYDIDGLLVCGWPERHEQTEPTFDCPECCPCDECSVCSFGTVGCIPASDIDGGHADDCPAWFVSADGHEDDSRYEDDWRRAYDLGGEG